MGLDKTVRADVRPSVARASRFEIVKLEPEHARGLMLADPQAYGGPPLDDPAYCAALAAAGPSYTALVDGEPVACLGVIPIHEGVGAAWGLIGRDAGPHLLALTRAVVRFLKNSDFRRVQIVVALGFAACDRWARLLGFEIEGRMREYLPNGSDAVSYAWLSQSVNHRSRH